jgi:hypothetical protein
MAEAMHAFLDGTPSLMSMGLPTPTVPSEYELWKAEKWREREEASMREFTRSRPPTSAQAAQMLKQEIHKENFDKAFALATKRNAMIENYRKDSALVKQYRDKQNHMESLASGLGPALNARRLEKEKVKKSAEKLVQKAKMFQAIGDLPTASKLLVKAEAKTASMKIPVPPNTPVRQKRKVSQLTLKQKSVVRKLYPEAAVVPTPPLVGVEPNPGPKGKGRGGKRRVVPKRVPRRKPGRVQGRRKGMARGMGLSLSSNSAPVSIGYQAVMRNKLRNTVVSHCEQIAEITAANAANYSLQVPLQINPGLAVSFPWLSQIAQNYEAYEFKKLEFHFIPYVSSATAGYNAMNFDYNPQEESSTQFPSKQTFTDYDGAVQCNAWEGFSMKVRCPNMEGGNRIRTIRTGGISGSYDLHCYDHGQFNFAVGASSGTSAIGTLYVCYSVALMRPRISVQGTAQGALAGGSTNVSGSSAKTSLFGSGAVVTNMDPDSTIGFGIVATGSLGVTNPNIGFQSQPNSLSPQINTNNAYLVAYVCVGGTLALITGRAASIAANAEYTVVTSADLTVNETGTTISGWGIVRMTGGTGDGVVLNLGSATITGAAVTQVVMYVAQIPESLTLTTPERRFNKYMDKQIAAQLTEEKLAELIKKYVGVKNWNQPGFASPYLMASDQDECKEEDKEVARAVSSLPKKFDTLSIKSLGRR